MKENSGRADGLCMKGTAMSKKAWEIELNTMKNSVPVILKEEEQGWNYAEQLERVENENTRMRWESHVPGSYATEHVIIAAMQDMENMGYDVSEAEALIEEGEKLRAADDVSALCGITARVMYVLMSSPKIPEHPHWRYTVYESFGQHAAKVSFPVWSRADCEKDLEKKTLWGWQGQIVGGAIGTAIEGYTTDNIRKAFGEVRGYVRKPNTYNDDITYELALLKAVEKKGRAVTAADIAEQWVALIPMGWSAEDIALQNLKLGVFPPESGYRNNPYREWIGAQMRGAVCGMLYPGKPGEAARLAWTDGQISHHNNGILGEVFNAVLTSIAYVVPDIRRTVETAISLIPDDSEYYSVISFALAQCRKYPSWEEAWRVCEKKYERYNWIHAYPNAAAEVIALWYGAGDFDETMHICAMEGYDVDCNAAQIGTVVAISSGKAPAEHWLEPIGDELITYMRGNASMSIRQLSLDTVRLSRIMNEEQ